MKYFDQTIEACRRYLLRDPHIKKCYSKLDVSSSKGFMYEYERGGYRILMDLRVEEKPPLVTLIAHADVLVKKERTAFVAKYCQMNSSPWEPGMLAISPTYHHTFYRITTPIIEAPLSEDSLSWMYNCAFEKIVKCREALFPLVNDDWSDQWAAEVGGRFDEVKQPSFPTGNLQETKKRLLEELRDSNHNILSENTDERDNSLFFSQIMTEDEIFHETITVHESGCLIVAVRPEFRVAREHLGRFVSYCNEYCSNRKLVGLHAFCRDGYLWFSSPISLWDGSVGRESVALIEMLGIEAVSDLQKAAQVRTWAQDNTEVEESEDESNKSANGRHLSPLERLAELRRIHSAPFRSPSPGVPNTDVDDPFTDFFGEYAYPNEGQESDTSFFDEDGTLPGFESLFAEEDGSIPEANTPQTGADTFDGGIFSESVDTECFVIPDSSVDEDT